MRKHVNMFETFCLEMDNELGADDFPYDANLLLQETELLLLRGDLGLFGGCNSRALGSGETFGLA